MAKFEVTGARQELGFTPSTNVRANIDVRTDVGGIGPGLVQFAGRAIQKLQRREQFHKALEAKNRKNRDSNSSALADRLRDKATQDFNAFALTARPQELEPFRIKQAEGLTDEIGKLDFSPKELIKENIKSGSYASIEPAKAFATGTRRLRDLTIEIQAERLTEVFRSKSPEEVAVQVREFSESMRNNGKTAGEIVLDIKAAREAGGKLRKRDILDSWQDRIAENPVVTAEILNDELVARKENKGVISEDELTSENIQSLLNTAINRQSQLTANAQAELNAKNTALETQLHDDILAGTASITEIAKSSLPAANKRRLEQDISDTDKRNIAKNWALQDSPDTLKKVNSILINIESGISDINEARNAINELEREETVDGRSILTKKIFDKTMEQIKKGGRDAVDLFSDEQTDKVTNFLVSRLTEREARLRVRSEARTLTPKEKRQFSTTGFLLQVANHQLLLYKENLAQRLRTLGIEDTSGKEAKIEAVKIWEIIKRKPLERRINDFLTESGQRLVRPFGFPKETWEISDARNKAAIVNGVSKGMENNQILELLIK